MLHVCSFKLNFSTVLNSNSLALTIIQFSHLKKLIFLSCIFYRKIQKSNKTNKKILIILVTGVIVVVLGFVLFWVLFVMNTRKFDVQTKTKFYSLSFGLIQF